MTTVPTAQGEEAPPARPGLLRSTATITAWNAVSRATGFVRVLAVGAALGTTFLGNTYQSSNLVSNILFELLAAGLIAAPLVPAFVAMIDRHRDQDAERLAGGLLSLALVGLGAVALAGMLAGRPVMRVLTVGVDDPQVRAAEIALGSFWLWFFLPQVLLYAVGAVASALLNSARRFAAVAFAPVANNLVVIGAMVAFIAMGRGGDSLDLTLGAKLVLAIGTTLGVLAMAAVPVVAARRAGFHLWPRRPHRHDPELRGVLRVGGWSAAYLATNQLLIAVTLVLANRVAGGVVAYQIAFTFFLLPHALLAHPVFTALYPQLSADAAASRWHAFGGDLGAGTRVTLLLLLPASSALAVLGGPALRLVRLGALDAAGATFAARVLAAYAAGLAGYATLLLLVRAATAAGQARQAAYVGLAVTVGGAALMVLSSSLATGNGKVIVLGGAHAIAVTAGAVALFAVVRRRSPVAIHVGATIGRGLVAAGAGGLAAWAVVAVIGTASRAQAAAALVAGALAWAAGTAVALRLVGLPELGEIRALARGRSVPEPAP